MATLYKTVKGLHRLFSSLSSCEYFRIRSNNGVSSVRVIFVWMGSWGPAFMGPHVLHTLHTCHLRTWVEHKGHVLETRYYPSKTDGVRGFDPPLQGAVHLIGTRMHLAQRSLKLKYYCTMKTLFTGLQPMVMSECKRI